MDNNDVLFVAKQQRCFVFLYIIGCLIFVLGGMYLIHSGDIYAMKIGYIGIIFFGLFCLPIILIDFISPKILLCLRKNGFYIKSNKINKPILFEYKNISEIELLQVNSTKIICFNVKDKSKITQKQNFIKKAEMELNNLIIGYEFSISLSGTGADTEKVYEMMRALINENTPYSIP